MRETPRTNPHGLRNIAIAVMLVVALALPIFVRGNFWLYLCDTIFLNALIALGLNVIVKTGQLSFGHAAFTAIGGYTSAQLVLKFGLPFGVGFLAAGVLAGVIGGLLGRVILRLKGVYFVLFTFALNEFVFLMAKNFTWLTGGNSGLPGIPSPSLPFVDTPLNTPLAFYYLALPVLLVAIAFVALLYRSSFGRAMDAVRESETLAASTGYNPMRVKTIAFAIGCAMAGFGGSLYAHFLLYISPFNFTFWQSVNFLLMNIVGGTASLTGAVLGAALLTPLPELLRGYVLWQQVLYGLLLILFMRLLPDGVVAIPANLRELRRRWTSARAPAVGAIEPNRTVRP